MLRVFLCLLLGCACLWAAGIAASRAHSPGLVEQPDPGAAAAPLQSAAAQRLPSAKDPAAPASRR